MTDWYRRKSWTKDDEKEFFLKLNRARKDSRAKYLRIQAVELIETRNNYLLDIAEALLNRILIEYPESKFEWGLSLYSLGEIFIQKEDFEKSIQYFKQAIDFEKDYPKVKTNAYLIFSELVVKTGKVDLFILVENIILDRFSKLLFPIDLYKAASILSIISHYKKDFEKAKYYSNLADQNADLNISGLRYHKYLGIVKERDLILDKLVKRK